MIRKLVVASVLALASAPLLAAECSVEVHSTDQMTFDTKEIKVSKSCKTFTIDLKHVGTLPKNVMGHNVVLSKTADVAAISADGIAAGVDKDYLKADDERIIAHTKLIGGGESDSVTFDVDKLAAGESYQFFCSFPGHSSLMKGAVTLVD
ncbi:azurin [Phytopseudomonas dryadis]|uniref:Azurin n=1 Tax=Phytopseudomonas dryadis TaxID=2487520 RepID=A0A4Q9R7U6_9GAMM|nr:MULTISPECIES: azurin [Pseudomonas]TBU96664.1 azurin [Pseudomonas dryadis]TBV07320.1 azurin [Pseudomonas dryadis]TBV17815.1 azurin [Pseudomonas sp. FRB 230]